MPARLSIIIILFFLGFYWHCAALSGHSYADTDFFTFYQSMRFYFAGQHIYSAVLMLENHTIHSLTSRDLNPPFLTLLLLPFYYFNYAQTLQIWTVLSVILMFLSGYILLKIYIPDKKTRLFSLAAFGIYLPNMLSMIYGQVSNYLLLLIAVSFLAVRSRRDITAGIFIGLACALKLFCGLFLIYFLCIKRFRLLFSAAVTGGIIFMITSIVFGLKSYIDYYKTLSKIVWYTETWNVSFKGFFMRIFSPLEKNHVVFNAPHFGLFLVIIFSAGLLMGVIYYWVKLGRSSVSCSAEAALFKSDLGFSLVIISMLLLSPLGWIYYFNLLIIPYLFVVRNIQDDRIHLLCCGLLYASQLAGRLYPPFEIKRMSEIFYNGGMGFYVLIIFLGLFLMLIRQFLQSVEFFKDHSFGNRIKNKKSAMPKNLWIVVYIISSSPSMIAFFSLLRRVH